MTKEKIYHGYLVKDNGSIYRKTENGYVPVSFCYHNDGYLIACLKLNGKYKNLMVHRVVAECFIPNPENKPEVNHKDFNKENNHASNLEWVTHKENVQNYYKYSDNETQRGDKHPRAKITSNDIPDIFTLHKQGNSYRDIAEMYNVSHNCIGKVIRGESWQ